MKSYVKNLGFPLILMLTLICLLAVGCAKKPAATDIAAEDQMTTEDMGADSQRPMGIDESTIGEDSFGADGMADTTAAPAGLERIHFEFDQYNLTPDAQQTLVDNASYMKANPGVKVRIEGYCDERGSDEYNLALGQRRALAAKNYLVSLGVSPERLSVISYGEELPLDPSGTEEAYAMNRRAEFKAEM